LGRRGGHTRGERGVPVTFGVDEERKAKLEAELARALELLPRYGVERVYLVGSLARGDVRRGSDVDLVVVQETNVKFVNRLNDFLLAFGPRVAFDLLVYTPAEFEELTARPGFVSAAVRRGRLIYEKRR
jgi:predicted nucleotidyltransferase